MGRGGPNSARGPASGGGEIGQGLSDSPVVKQGFSRAGDGVVREGLLYKRVPPGGVLVLCQPKEVQVMNVRFLENLTDPVGLGLSLCGATRVVYPCTKKRELRQPVNMHSAYVT